MIIDLPGIRRFLRDGRLVFWVGLVLGVTCEAYALFIPSSPIRAMSAKPIVLEGFGAGVPVGQTFRMNAEALESVRVQFFASQRTELVVRCKLLTAANSWTSVYDWTTRVDLPVGKSWQRFQFPPVVRSDRKIYQFQVQKVEAHVIGSPASGAPTLGLVASVKEGLPEGNIVDGSVQLVDKALFFEAQSDDAVFSTFRRNVNPQLPEPLRSKILHLAVLAILNWALVVYAYEMIVAGPNRVQPVTW